MISLSEANKKELEVRTLSLPDKARSLRISDQAELTIANDFLLAIRALQQEINDTFDPIIKAAHEAHKEALAKKKKFEEPLAQAERIIRPAIAAYMAEQDRIRRQKEEEAQVAEKKAQCLEAEALQGAMKAEMAGDSDKAAQILAKAEIKKEALTVDVPDKIETNGLSVREVWKFEVVKVSSLPLEYLIPDLVKIGKTVREQKGATRISGVRVWPEETLAVRLS